MPQRSTGRPGNRRPLDIQPRATPSNRIPGAQLTPQRLMTGLAKAQVKEASDAAVVEEVAAGIPPDFTEAVNDLEAARADFETRISALEAESP